MKKLFFIQDTFITMLFYEQVHRYNGLQLPQKVLEQVNYLLCNEEGENRR